MNSYFCESHYRRPKSDHSLSIRYRNKIAKSARFSCRKASNALGLLFVTPWHHIPNKGNIT